jgi:hypothetical protein
MNQQGLERAGRILEDFIFPANAPGTFIGPPEMRWTFARRSYGLLVEFSCTGEPPLMQRLAVIRADDPNGNFLQTMFLDKVGRSLRAVFDLVGRDESVRFEMIAKPLEQASPDFRSERFDRRGQVPAGTRESRTRTGRLGF